MTVRGAVAGPVDGLVAFLSLEHGLEKQVADALKLFGRLELLTDWEESELLEALACSTTRHRDSDRETAAGALTLSIDFFKWLLVLISVTEGPVPAFSRAVVVGAVDLFLSAGEAPENVRLEQCRAAFDREEGVEFTSCDYLRLGEVGAAFHIAALGLPDTPAQARAQRLDEVRAELIDRPHVHPARLRKALADDAADELGRGVRRAIREHHGRCGACSAAVPADGRESVPAA